MEQACRAPQHIELAHGIKLSIRAVGNYLTRWGCTPPKPIKKAYEQRLEAVQAWLDERYPAIIEFLEVLIEDADCKIFLILDSLRVHHSKPVKAWAAKNAQKIELFYLPSYSPELNPEERLNADLKHAIRSKVPVRTKAKLQAATEEHINTISSEPERVRAYFQDLYVKYAA